jgi:hypothetical protein
MNYKSCQNKLIPLLAEIFVGKLKVKNATRDAEKPVFFDKNDKLRFICILKDNTYILSMAGEIIDFDSINQARSIHLLFLFANQINIKKPAEVIIREQVIKAFSRSFDNGFHSELFLHILAHYLREDDLLNLSYIIEAIFSLVLVREIKASSIISDFLMMDLSSSLKTRSAILYKNFIQDLIWVT